MKQLLRKYVFLAAFFTLATASTGLCADFRILSGNLLPVNYKAEGGTARGFAVEILIRLMNDAGLRADADDVRFEPWARAVEDTEMTPNTVLMTMAMTPQRKPRFKWVGPVFTMNLGLLAQKSRHIRIADWSDLNRYVIGVVRDSAPEQILSTKLAETSQSLHPLNSDLQQFRMLAMKRVDLVTHTDISAPLVIRQSGMNPDDFEMVFVLRSIDLYYAFNPETDDALIDELQEGLAALKKQRKDGSSAYMNIVAKHLQQGRIRMAP